MWGTPSALPITGHYLQFLASLSTHPFSLEIFPAVHLPHVTAEPRLRDVNRTAWNKCSVWGNGSHITNRLCQEEAWVSGKLSLLKFKIRMIDVGTFFTRSMKPGWFHWCRHSCQFLGQWWSHLLQAEWEPVCGVVICSPDTRTATAAPRSILI